MDWLQILAVAAGILMLVALWPRLKHWRENKIEAEPGAWSNAIFILGLVMLFVLLLVMSVQ
jgi:hypothetical protein